MDKLQKGILIIIIIVVILLIGIISMYITLKQDEQLEEHIYYEIYEIEPKQGIGEIDTYNQYYSLLECIEKYYQKIGQKKNQEVYSLLDIEYIQKNNITTENVLEKVTKINTQIPNYYIQNIRMQETDKVSMFYICGHLREMSTSQNFETTYLIVYLDNYNATYSIYPITNQEYEQLVVNGQDIGEKQIEKNDYNRYETVTINTGKVATKLFEDYQYKIKNDIEKSYEILDSDYREKKFSNIEEYKKYINKSTIKDAKISKYDKTSTEEYTQYICVDRDENYYIIRENGVMNYSIILDTYTIDLPEFIEKYESSDEQTKVALNIEKIKEAINDGDFKYVYNKLDETYKKNNFSDYIKLENYLKTKLFEQNNFEYKKVEQKGSVYVATVIVTNKDDLTAEAREIEIIMKLTDTTDYSMSFSIEE